MMMCAVCQKSKDDIMVIPSGNGGAFSVCDDCYYGMMLLLGNQYRKLLEDGYGLSHYQIEKGEKNVI